MNGESLNPSDKRCANRPGVPLASTRAAASVLERIANMSDEPNVSPLLICGASGTGKTHLLDNLCGAANARKTAYWDASELCGLRERSERLTYWQRGTEADLVVMDDVDLVVPEQWLADELASYVDRWVRGGGCVVATTTLGPSGWGASGQRLRDRLSAGVTISLRHADLAERCSLIRHFSGASALPAEVVDWLAARVPDNLRRLRACTLQLLCVQCASHAPIDVARARVVLEEAGQMVQNHAPAKAGDVLPPSRRVSGVFAQVDIASARKTRFKEMLTEAETDDEKRLALEIALGERIRELRLENAADERIARFEQALGLLRQGHLEAALQYIA